MSLLQDVLRATSDNRGQYGFRPENFDSDDDWINVTSTPGSPYTTRPSSPSRRQPCGVQSISRRDPLRLFPIEVCQRIFVYLSVPDLANCALVCRKWWRSQTLNYVWFHFYRRENFVDTSLPPGKWTKRESKQNWRVLHLKSLSEKVVPMFSKTPTTDSASQSGYQTPRDKKEEQWRLESEAGYKPGKLEMRGMYKELGGRKPKNKLKLGSSGVRDKGGWVESTSECYGRLTSPSKMRQIVSYADITPPSTGPSVGATTNSDGHISKKSKKSSQARNMHLLSSTPGTQGSWAELEQSRELTHEEIWDDSALVEAWNAATEEYEALNGPGKSWKEDPVHKASLWYNIPPEFPKAKLGSITAPASVLPASADDPVDDREAEGDSQPLDFDSYVPTYNPNLGYSQELPQRAPIAKVPNLTEISQDEALARAMNAMYWAGYWTAVYQSHHQDQGKTEEVPEDEDLDGCLGSEDG